MTILTLATLALAQQPPPDLTTPMGRATGKVVSQQEAVALGMPRLHEPFTDCQCVGMTWPDPAGEALVHELSRADIRAVRHDVLDGPHELTLVLSTGEEMLLEQAPCRYVELAARKYGYVLGVDAVTVDSDGVDVKNACGGPIVDVASMQDMHERAMAAEQVRVDDRNRARMELVSAKGEPQVVLGLRSTLNEAAMGAGQCFGRAPVPSDARVDVTVSTRGDDARFKARPIGVDAVDRCFDALADKVAFPTGKAKIRVAYVFQAE